MRDALTSMRADSDVFLQELADAYEKTIKKNEDASRKGLAGIAGANQAAVKAQEDAIKRAEELHKKVEAMAKDMAGTLATAMQSFFENVAKGTANLGQVFEALGKAIVKSMALAIAQTLEAKAAEQLAFALGTSLNPLTAFMSPGHTSAAIGYSAAAGAIRASAAAFLDRGGMAQGSGNRDSLPAMIRPGEGVLPFGNPGAMRQLADGLGRLGMGGGLKIGQLNLKIMNKVRMLV